MPPSLLFYFILSDLSNILTNCTKKAYLCMPKFFGELANIKQSPTLVICKNAAIRSFSASLDDFKIFFKHLSKIRSNFHAFRDFESCIAFNNCFHDYAVAQNVARNVLDNA